VIPVVVCAVAAAMVAKRLPNKYLSETLVLVVPQRVPTEYVRRTVTTRIEDRVLSIREQILSRSRLERIVEELNLYPQLRGQVPMEEIIDDMRVNVNTRVVRDDAFTVSFVAASPIVAQKVTERLAGMFSEENMRDREVQAESTNQFLQTQLDDARQRLAERERVVEEYRKRYAGELPDQVPSNLQAIQNAEIQIQTLTQALNTDRERRLLLERQIADATSLETPLLPGPVPSAGPPAPTPAQQLDAAEAALRALEARLTPEHPDVIHARLAVQRLLAQRSNERTAAGDSGAPRLSAAEAARRNRINELRAQLDAADRQIAQKVEEERRLRGVVATYRARVESATTRQTELVSLTRDYETLQTSYRGLLAKYEESKVAANLERRQIGEQFRILDPASLPERPFTPNRRLIVAAGAAAGLMLGLVIGGLFEFLDKSVRTGQDVSVCCALPVLAALPQIPTREERQRARRLRFAGYFAGSLAGIALAVLAVFWKLGRL
jgi:polysaccharide chain length determinant protein (PEP-CTERM system associated)